MTPFGGFVLAVALLLVLDGLACLLVPLLRSHLAWQRAMQTSEQVRVRALFLLGAGAVGLLAVAVVL